MQVGLKSAGILGLADVSKGIKSQTNSARVVLEVPSTVNGRLTRGVVTAFPVKLGKELAINN